MDEYSLARAFKRIEQELIFSMIRNFEKHKAEELDEGFNWDQWQVVQLRELEKYRRKNLEKFDEDFSEINDQIAELFRMALEDGQAEEEAKILEQILRGVFLGSDNEYGEMPTSFFGINDRKLESLIQATTDDMEKAEHAILRRANDLYRRTIYDAQIYAANGGTYEQAIDMATKDFCKKGIRSIEYKDGSRHNISEYAEMAIRTGNKRAYLMGEGNMHAKYGVHTIYVKKRPQACPLCLRWTGRVLIDDVYGGGTAEESKRKGIPLLSTAMDLGFLHPNCKDVYSLFIPGVDDETDPWTEEEIRDLADDYNKALKKKRAEREAEEYDMLAKTRLDPENRRAAEAKAEAWLDRAKAFKQESEEFYGHKLRFAAFSGGAEARKALDNSGLDEHYVIHTVDFNNYMWEHHPEFFGSRDIIDQAIRDQYNRQFNTELWLIENDPEALIREVDMLTYMTTPGSLGTMVPDFESYKAWNYENRLHLFAQDDTMFNTFVRWEQGATEGGYGKGKGARLIFDEETGLSDFIAENPDLHYNGDTLYRGLMTNKAGIKDLQKRFEEGKPIDMRGPSSWTTRQGVAKTFSEHSLRKNTNKVVFIEEGKHKRNAIPFPYSSTIHQSGMLQNEVIYSKYAEFDILNITEKEGVYYVRVRERV